MKEKINENQILYSKWESIYKSTDKVTETSRAKVPGGWLVNNTNCIFTDEIGAGKGARRYAMSESTIFINDPNH